MTRSRATRSAHNSTTSSFSIRSHVGTRSRLMSIRAGRNLLIAFSLCMGLSIASSAQTFRVLFRFNGTTDGTKPLGPLVQGFDGNLYGQTTAGGTNSDGTVFKISTAGTLTTIHNFCSLANCADGGFPATGLLLGKDGNFYGGTYGHAGKIFKVTPTGQFTVLYSFCSLMNCADGSFLQGPLIQGWDGNFYGA